MNLKNVLRPIPTCLALAAALVLTAVPGCAQEGDAAAKPTATADASEMSEESKTFYALGQALGQNLDAFSLTEEELATVEKGLRDSVMGKEAKVDLAEYGPKLQALAQERVAAAAVKEKAAADVFLAAEAAKQGAIKSDSGLIMTEMTPGTGASPTATDTVEVHYHGTLRDGKVFDSSVDRGEPVSFPLNQVIPCWTEGVQKMKVGGKSRLVCPASIAYGEQGRPGIPGNAPLVFEVELLSIEAPAAPPADS
jgi:FKBP-type peptidyl-prolyl cis-trans isomerase